MAAEPDRRYELDDAPPFASWTWGRVYFVVLGALAVQIAIYGFVTWALG